YLVIRRYLEENSLYRKISEYRRDGRILVLCEGDEIIGFVGFLGRGESCWVTYQFVDPGYQGRGYGVKLNDALFDVGFRELGFTKIWGATSSIQRGQLKLQKKYIGILNEKKGVRWKLELVSEPAKYKWVPIYRINIIYTKI
ncbi:MAG: hypothetical protein Hyperionvirus13_1, partial [Hyperionvirus sp.]